MPNVDEIRKVKVFCPNCLERIYDGNQMHLCGQKRLIGARRSISRSATQTVFVVQEGTVSSTSWAGARCWK